jgi:hypothetical protein
MKVRLHDLANSVFDWQSLPDFARALAADRAWQLAEAMKAPKISRNRMAASPKTSRTQVDRLLDPRNDITFSSLQRAAAMVGRRVMIQLV